MTRPPTETAWQQGIGKPGAAQGAPGSPAVSSPAARRDQAGNRHRYEADIHDEQAVADALADAYSVVNAVSLYVERGQETFHSVHVEAAQRIATQARRAGRGMVSRSTHPLADYRRAC